MENTAIKSFMIFKVTEKEKDTSPDYRLTANLGTKEAPRWVELGAGWVKEGNKGKFISIQLKDAYQDRSGFHITEEPGEVKKKLEYPEGPNPDDIQF